MPRPLLLTVPLGLVGLFGLATCGLGDSADGPAPTAEEASAPAPPAPGETRDGLVVAALEAPQNLLPFTLGSDSDGEVAALIYEDLARATFDCGLTWKPGLATEWRWSDDGLKVDFTLDDSLRWQDGQPVTARDLVAAMDWVRDPAVASPRSAHYETLAPGPQPTVLDDGRVRFTFAEPSSRDRQWLSLTAVPPVANHQLADVPRDAVREHPANLAPLANGPFQVGRHEPGRFFELVPNPTFAGPPERQAKLDRILFKVLPDYDTRLLELTRGEVDLMSNLEVADAERLKAEHPELRILQRPPRQMDYIGWNNADPRFDTVAVRRALTMALDLDALLARLFTGEDGTVYAQPAVSTITPALCDAVPDDLERLPHDPEAARAALAEAGWTDTDGDGVLDQDGEPFAFELLYNAGNERRRKVAVYAQEALGSLGLKVDVTPVETSQFYTRLKAGDFAAAVAGWNAGLVPNPTVRWRGDRDLDGDGATDGPGEHETFNLVRYGNPEVDALIAKASRELDPSATLAEIQRLIYEDQPYTFLWWRDELLAIHERFEGVEPDILSRLHGAETWWVPDHKVKYR